MNELSLFTGAGGGVYASKLLGHRVVGYVEWNDYCQRVIAQRIQDGIFDRAPIFGDIDAFIREGYADRYRGMVDIVSAGPPCQAHSSAARGRNNAEDKWPATAEVVCRVRPRFIFIENVAGVRTRLQGIVDDLDGLGYTVTRPATVTASSVGAPHTRDRVWILAHANEEGQPTGSVDDEVAEQPAPSIGSGRGLWWETRPSLCGVDDGMASWSQRRRTAGEGQVPAVAAVAFRLLMSRAAQRP